MTGPGGGRGPLDWHHPDDADDGGGSPWLARSGCLLALACAVLVIVATVFATWGVSMWLGW